MAQRPIYVDVHQLIAFVNALERVGFNIGQHQLLAAQDLIASMVAHGLDVSDTALLKKMLGPVLCTSEKEQKEFDEKHFDDWAPRLLRQHDRAVEAPPLEELQEVAPATTLDEDIAGIRHRLKNQARWGWVVVAAVFIVLLANYLGNRTDVVKTGTIGLYTERDQANIWLLADSTKSEDRSFIDTDSLAGQTPLLLTDVPVGPLPVRVEWPRYGGGFDTLLQVVEGANEEVRFAPRLGTVVFTGLPEDTEVLVDGRPFTTDTVIAGEHSVRIRKRGFVDLVTSFSVGNGERASLTLDMVQQRYGAIEVSSSPIGAEVTLNDETIGYTGNGSVERDSIPVGTHRISISLNDFTPVDTTIEITEGRTVSLAPTLRLNTGSIFVTTNEVEGALFIDGEPVGVVDERGILYSNVSTGTHQVRVTSAGYEPFNASVDVNVASVSRVNAVLNEEQPSIFNVAFTASGNTLAVGSADESVVLLDVENRRAVDTLQSREMSWTRVGADASGNPALLWDDIATLREEGAASIPLDSGAVSGLRVGSGSLTGNYFRVATQVEAQFPEGTFEVLNTGGSIDNLERLVQKELDLAIVQNDMVYLAETAGALFDVPYDGLRAVMALYPEPIFVVTNQLDAANLSDLGEAPISVGPAGSGTAQNAASILDAYGLTDEANSVHTEKGEIAAAFDAGDIQAVFLNSAPPEVLDRLESGSLKVFSMHSSIVAKLEDEYPYFNAIKTEYAGYKVQTVAVKSLLVARDDVDTSAVYAVTRALVETWDTFTAAFPSHRSRYAKPDMLRTHTATEWHPGAWEYYEEIGLIDIAGVVMQERPWHQRLVQNVSYSGDLARVAAVEQDGLIEIWDTQTREVVDEIGVALNSEDEGPPFPSAIPSLSYSPDGRFLAFSDEGGRVQLKTITPWPIKTLVAGQGPVRDLAFSPDSVHHLVTVSDNVILWDVVSGHAQTIMEDVAPVVNSMAFAPDGSHIVSGGVDDVISMNTLWPIPDSIVSLSTGHVGVLRDHLPPVWSGSFNPNESTAASGSRGKRVQALGPLGGSVGNLAYSSDGLRMAAVYDQASLAIWDTSGVEKLRSGNTNARITEVAFSPDGTVLVIGTDNDGTPVVNVVSGETIGVLPHNANAVAYSPDGQRIALGAADGAISLWRGQLSDETGEFEHALLHVLGAISLVRSLAFSPDGELLASGTSGGIVTLWDAWGDAVEVIEGDGSGVHSVDFSADGKYLAIGYENGKAQVWDIGLTHSLAGHNGTVQSIAFSPDGERLASVGADGSMKVWDTNERVMVDSLSMEQPILSVAYNTVGTLVAVTTADSSVVVLRSATRMATLQGWFSGWGPPLVGLLAVIGGVMILIRIGRRREAAQLLRREQSDEQPHLEFIKLKGYEQKLFSGLSVFKLARGLRQRYEVPSAHLHLPATVRETVHRGGAFTPRFRTRKEVPEYLALIDRSSFNDHQARYFEELLLQLKKEDVYIKHYYFDGDPRLCTPHNTRRQGRRKGIPRRWNKPVPLLALPRRHPNHRLLLFADTNILFNAVTGDRQGWVDLLLPWEKRALITPASETHWRREHELKDTFDVIPATPQGLITLAGPGRPSGVIHGIPKGISNRELNGKKKDTLQPYPRLLRWQPSRWLERDAPPESEVNEMLDAVKHYLGPDGFYWFSACAIYPTINWQLTINMGEALHGGDDKLLMSAEGLMAMARLPWLRKGFMPDWLRSRLIAGIEPEQEQHIRALLDTLLLNAVRGDEEVTDLEIARRNTRLLDTLARPMMQLLNKRVAPTHPLRDYVFLSFMTGKETDPLSVRVSRAFEGVIRRPGGTTLPPRHAADARSIRRTILSRLLLAVIFVALLWDVWQNLEPSPIEPDVLFALDMSSGEPPAQVEKTARAIEQPPSSSLAEIPGQVEATCVGPNMMEIGSEGAFEALTNYQAIEPIHYEWRVDGQAVATQRETMLLFYTPGDVTVTVTATNSLGSDTATCSVSVREQLLTLGQEYQGGKIYYIDESREHGLIAYMEDLGPASWDGAIQGAEDFEANGFSDWRLPTLDEMNLLYDQRAYLGEFQPTWYWSSTEGDGQFQMTIYFLDGTRPSYLRTALHPYRVIRDF